MSNCEFLVYIRIHIDTYYITTPLINIKFNITKYFILYVKYNSDKIIYYLTHSDPILNDQQGKIFYSPH